MQNQSIISQHYSSTSFNLNDLLNKINQFANQQQENLQIIKKQSQQADFKQQQSFSQSRVIMNKQSFLTESLYDKLKRQIDQQLRFGDQQIFTESLYCSTQYRQQYINFQNQNPKLLPMTIQDFEIGKSIGSGKFGQVYLGRHISTGSLYAIKKVLKSIFKSHKQIQNLIFNEIKINISLLNKQQHESIVKVYDVIEDEFHIFIIMDYIYGLRLKDLFGKFKNEQQIAFILKQILHSIEFLHKKGIIHRDLKGQNILLSFSSEEIHQATVKIIDFGWSTLYNPKKQQILEIKDICGTLQYVCPQMVNNIPYSQKVDLWSVGILAYEMFYGKSPFQAKTKTQVFQNVKNLKLQFNSAGKQISESLKSFIEGYLTPETERKTLLWGLQHNLFTAYCSQTIESNKSFQQMDNILGKQ